jgi:hypothetical protein
MPRRARSLALPTLLALAACGGAPAPAATPAPRAKAAPAAQAARDAVFADRLLRRDLEAVVTRNGPPWLLGRVVPEEVFREGKFVGWKLVTVPNDWAPLDLRAGDIVTRVNGTSLERPEDAWTAWTSVLLAKEISVDLERDGKARTLVLHIDGEPMKELPAALRSDAPPPRPARPHAKPTVVIVGDTPAAASDEP